MSFEMKYSITKKYLTSNTKRRPGIKMPKVRFVVAHDTGNDGSTANGNVTYYENSRNDMYASAHLFVDDKEIIECIPALTAAPEKAWHVLYDRTLDNELYGDDANDAAIGVELCYSSKGKINNEEAYKRFVWVMAYICHKFELNPAKVIIGHEKLDPGRKTDPSNALRHMGKTYAQLLQDVVKEYEECTKESVVQKKETTSKTVKTTSASSKVEKDLTLGTVTVKVGTLNVRKADTFASDIVGTVSKGEKFTVYAKQNGMYKIGPNRWISAGSDYVSFSK